MKARVLPSGSAPTSATSHSTRSRSSTGSGAMPCKRAPVTTFLDQTVAAARSKLRPPPRLPLPTGREQTPSPSRGPRCNARSNAALGLPERYSRRDHGSDDRAGHGQEMRPRHGYGVSEVRLSRRTARHGRRRHGGDDRREARPSRSRTAARATPAHQLSPKNGRDGTQAAATATVEVLGQSRRRSAPRRRRIASRDLSGRCRRR